MKAIVTILLVCVCAVGRCQSNYGAPGDSLTDYATGYAAEGQYDSALYFFLQLNKNYPDYEACYTLYKLGDCYRNLGDTASAETYFMRCLAMDDSKEFTSISKHYSSLALGDIYRNRKEFSKALEYYNASTSIYRMRGVTCGTGPMVDRYRVAVSEAACFEGLKKYDVVVKMLLPYMFQDYTRIPAATCVTDSLSRVYVDAVVHAYGRKQSKRELEKQ